MHKMWGNMQCFSMYVYGKEIDKEARGESKHIIEASLNIIPPIQALFSNAIFS